MANYTVQGSIASSTVATSVTLTPRWSYITVQNEGTVGIWVRTDGAAATIGGDLCFYVPPAGDPDSTALLANMAPLWTQAASVIPAAAAGAAAYAVASGNGPAEVTPMGTSPYGQTADPGTTVSVILATGTTAQSFVVSAAG